MTFSIIGTGNIAYFLGTRLMTARHHCVGVYSRDLAAAKLLSEKLLSDKYGTIDQVSDEDAHGCFLAVSDGAIPELAAKLRFKNTILVHTAGAVSIDSINKAPDAAVLWPVYSISRNALPAHRNIPCAWEASSEKASRYVQAMGHAVTDELFEARYEQRKWLHLSAVIGNNFINHLMAICEQICKENELPFAVLMPIIEQTFDRLKHTSPQNVQTGPAARNDTATIQSQLQLLENHPRWQQVYDAITRSIQDK